MFSKRMFPGGIHPHEGAGGKIVNGGNAIVDMAAPAQVTIPLSQHIGAPAKAVVAKGDRVLMGQVIGEAGGFVSAPVHSSVSGTVVAVQECMMANGLASLAVVIENDYKDEWVELHPSDHPETLSAQELCDIVRNAGIVGLGGAGFPTAVKLTPNKDKKVEYLVINGAECEPYLTADHRLMLEEPNLVVDGIRLVMLALDVKKAYVGIENNKMDAVAAMRAAASQADGIEICPLPVRYPQGGEKQLVYATTRRKVPTGGLPLDVGCVVSNVGTCHAISRAVREGRPIVDRITTVGGLVNNPNNFRVRIGTSVASLVEACGGTKPEMKKFVIGGPMMGMSVTGMDLPVTKTCGGVLALGQEAVEPQESPCIRCGRCARACPMQLLPAKIDNLARRGLVEGAEKAGAMNCLECGACTFVCPAKRSLTQSCRMAKKLITQRRKQAAQKKEG